MLSIKKIVMVANFILKIIEFCGGTTNIAKKNRQIYAILSWIKKITTDE